MIEATHVEKIFNQAFRNFNTQLRGGANEPIYRAASGPSYPNLIWYRHDYTASALHEVSHWCLAGKSRRKIDDFGYWYIADRSSSEQLAFEQVEARPQALEWILSIAAGLPFRVSVDDCYRVADAAFKQQVQLAVERMRADLPVRGRIMALALANVSKQHDFLNSQHFERLPL
jgi:elongation factor P hydroxylase